MKSPLTKSTAILLLSGIATSFSSSAIANTTEDEIRALKQRIAALESNPLRAANWDWMGALQLDASYTDDYNNNSQSDLVVSKALLGIEAKLQPDLLGSLTLIYEEDATELELDEVFLSYGINEYLAVTAGQIYLPFGQFKSAALVDPLTLDLGETRETAAMIAYQKNGLNLRFYVFNGETDVNGDVIDNFGLRFHYDVKSSHGEGAFSVDFINNIIDSDLMQD
ncbi:MAG: LbtU family siderophore porin [Pseudomonadales bacterium]|nr:LbtU family siderophore porin [Pseudomonadales bacterium]